MAHVVGGVWAGGVGLGSWVCVGRAVGGAAVRVLRWIVFLKGGMLGCWGRRVGGASVGYSSRFAVDYYRVKVHQLHSFLGTRYHNSI